MGLIALPIMLKYNYDRDISLGCIVAGGTLGQLIPPSVMIILYGAVTGTSVGKMFAAAFVCGPILSVLYIAYILIRSYFQSNLCPTLPVEERAGWLEKLRSLRLIALPVLLIIAVLGSIFSGAATPTEAAAVGAAGAAVCAAVRGKLKWSTIKDAAIGTIKQCGMIGWILIGSLFFASVFNAVGGAAMVRDLITAMPGGNMGALIAMLVILLILGMLIDVVAIVVIAAPLFVPIALQLGFDPTWFGLLFMIMLQMGYISPPFGWSLFFLKGVVPQDISMGNIYRGAYAFLGLQAIGVVIFVLFPEVVLWLPNIIVPAA
jgi:tripartite ATP-independent transporter DctM subunit